MSNSRIPLILGALVVLVIAFGWLRPRPNTPAGSPPPASVSPTPPAPPAIPPRLTSSRTAAPPPPEAPIAETLLLPELPPANVEQLRPEREALYQQLHGETNAVLAEVEAALRPFQITDPATLASAWTLANNWGILAHGESTVDQRVEDPVMRKQLSDLHRRVLIERAELDLRALFAGNLPAELPSRLEAIGRQNASSATVRRSLPDDTSAADRKAARTRASAGEDPSE